MRKINQEGLELIKSFEGLELKAYKDIVGVWTIGYGHTGSDVHEGLIITKEQAEELLKSDLSRFEKGVETACSGLVLTDNQFAALVSFSYNLGLGNFNSSTLLKKLKSKDMIGASNEFQKWNKAGGKVVAGLTRRRLAEQDLFLKK
jgi:lysozyme